MKCWVLGQKLLSTSFKDAIIDAVAAKVDELGRGCVDLCRIPFNESTPSLALRRLLADVVVYTWKLESLEGHDGTALLKFPEHLLDVARALNKVKMCALVGRTSPMAKSDCTYHEHVVDGTPCYKTLF